MKNKPSAQKKAKRAEGKKRAAKKVAKQKVKIKKKALHEQRKKEKAEKGTKRRKSFEKQLRIRKNNVSEEGRKKPMKTPTSRKYQRSPKDVAAEKEVLINTIAEKNATATAKKN